MALEPICRAFDGRRAAQGPRTEQQTRLSFEIADGCFTCLQVLNLVHSAIIAYSTLAMYATGAGGR